MHPTSQRILAEITSGKRPRTIFTDLAVYGHDEDFVPKPASKATDAPSGSKAKVEVMINRVMLGEALWHDSDNQRSVPMQRNRYPVAMRELFMVSIPQRRKGLGN